MTKSQYKNTICMSNICKCIGGLCITYTYFYINILMVHVCMGIHICMHVLDILHINVRIILANNIIFFNITRRSFLANARVELDSFKRGKY